MDGGQKGEASVRRSLLVWLSLTSLFPRDLSPMRSSPSTDFKKVGSLLFINLRASHPSHSLVFPRDSKERIQAELSRNRASKEDRSSCTIPGEG